MDKLKKFMFWNDMKRAVILFYVWACGTLLLKSPDKLLTIFFFRKNSEKNSSEAGLELSTSAWKSSTLPVELTPELPLTISFWYLYAVLNTLKCVKSHTFCVWFLLTHLKCVKLHTLSVWFLLTHLRCVKVCTLSVLNHTL